jgi:hypothetical protein
MNEPILSRQAIAEDADRAAQRCVQSGAEQPNPHPEGTEAAACWRNAYLRYLLLHSTPHAEASA